MQVQRPRPWNSKLPDPVISGGGGGASPLERNLQSPKGWKKREPDCIGLAIVAALEKAGSEADAEAKARLVVGASSCLHASAPIAIANPRTAAKAAGVFSEDSSDVGCTGRCADHGGGGGGGFFCVSPPAWGDESPAAYRMADFLSHCNLCRKRLHGKDIYMYRGDKAFCSIECRYQQIVSDESFKKEKCWSEASKKPSDVAAASPYSGGARFFLITGIAAA